MRGRRSRRRFGIAIETGMRTWVIGADIGAGAAAAVGAGRAERDVGECGAGQFPEAPDIDTVGFFDGAAEEFILAADADGEGIGACDIGDLEEQGAFDFKGGIGDMKVALVEAAEHVGIGLDEGDDAVAGAGGELSGDGGEAIEGVGGRDVWREDDGIEAPDEGVRAECFTELLEVTDAGMKGSEVVFERFSEAGDGVEAIEKEAAGADFSEDIMEGREIFGPEDEADDVVGGEGDGAGLTRIGVSEGSRAGAEGAEEPVAVGSGDIAAAAGGDDAGRGHGVRASHCSGRSVEWQP